MYQNNVSAEAKHRLRSKFDYKYGFYVLHRKHLHTRKKGFGIQTRAVCTQQQLREAARKPRRGTVNMLEQRYQRASVTLGDSDISKGVTTWARRKKNEFLAGQK